MDLSLCQLVVDLFEPSKKLWKIMLSRWMRFNIEDDFGEPPFGNEPVEHAIFCPAGKGKLECDPVTMEDFAMLDRYGFKYVIVANDNNRGIISLCSNFPKSPHVLQEGETYLTLAQFWCIKIQ